MEEERLKSILASLLFAAGEPVSIARLTAVFDDVPRATVQKALAEMASQYAAENRGIVIDEVAGGYQMRTPKDHAGYVRKLLAARPPRLSRPLMETVAIIAYRQPITRPEIEQLRGVDTGGVLETLLEKRLVKIAGRKEAPGRPIIYETTAEFLELFGLKDLEGPARPVGVPRNRARRRAGEHRPRRRHRNSSRGCCRESAGARGRTGRARARDLRRRRDLALNGETQRCTDSDG